MKSIELWARTKKYLNDHNTEKKIEYENKEWVCTTLTVNSKQ